MTAEENQSKPSLDDKEGTPQLTFAPPPPQAVSNTPVAETTGGNKKRNGMLWKVTLIILLIGLIWFLLWFFIWQYERSTDDAYVNGNMVNLTSVVAGAPIAFYCDDTDLVVEGQLLVELDETPFQVEFDRQKASFANTVLQVMQLYDSVKQNEANVNSKRIAFKRAQYDFNNRSHLINSQAISNEDYIHAQDISSTSEYDLKQAEYQLKMSKDLAGTTSIEEHPMIEVAKNKLLKAYYNLKHCKIYAPTTGYVAKRNVEVGQWVTPQIAMLTIIPMDYIWVDANFKETQLTYMRIGQPAKISIDMYGNLVEFEGKVLGIASGSGSVFSLIPPQNATGNWIKIVQRLPVRLSLNPNQLKKFPLRLGISAYATVDITQTDGPLLAPAPVKKTIAQTSVFDLNFDELNTEIDQIIQDSLKEWSKGSSTPSAQGNQDFCNGT